MKIFLRDVSLEDSSKIIKWRNSPNIINNYIDQTPITEESNRKFFEENVKTGQYRQYIVEKADEDFGVFSYSIASVFIKDIDQMNKKCELCILPSPDYEWNDEAKSLALHMLTEKAFYELGMHKVYAMAFADSKEEIDLLKSAGFSVEARLVEEIRIGDGEYRDLIRLSVIEKINKEQ